MTPLAPLAREYRPHNACHSRPMPPVVPLASTPLTPGAGARCTAIRASWQKLSEGDVVTCRDANEPSPGADSVDDGGNSARAAVDAREEDR